MTSPTAALLWAACGVVPSADEITAALRDGADVDLAGHVAVAQRVSPLLQRALLAAGAPVPDAVARDAARVYAQSRLLFARATTLALSPLAEAGFPPLIIKGAALAHRYGDVALRPMDDIDIVLPPSQIDSVLHVLTDCGWRYPSDTPADAHEVGLTHPELPGLHVDLHRSLSTWRTRANRLRASDLWDGRQRSSLEGIDVFTLPPALELVMLAAHAAKPYHGFDRMIWSADFAVVISNADMPWDAVSQIARAARAQTALAVALHHADRLGAPSPVELRRLSPRRRRALGPVLSADWPLVPRTGPLRARLRNALVDDLRLRVSLTAAALSRTPVREMPRRAVTLRTRRRWPPARP